MTGGIGAGKSAVLHGLADLGAEVIDSDEVARDVVAEGTDGFAEVAAAFGPGVIDAGGALDRSALAAIVFSDAGARARLEAIVHPRVRAETRRRMTMASRDAIVVNAVPLLVETGGAGDYDVVVVVEAPLELRLERLARDRAMSREDALARVGAQATDAQRAAVAWKVVSNDGSLEELNERVRDLWAALRTRAGIT
ncbi:MAG: dephospho-CoA kinase [Actinomycetota bacterium]|nr:dephospho-CoA kinase [Actinomycetota bacterium]